MIPVNRAAVTAERGRSDGAEEIATAAATDTDVPTLGRRRRLGDWTSDATGVSTPRSGMAVVDISVGP